MHIQILLMDILRLAQKARKSGKWSPPISDVNDLCPQCKKNKRVYCPHKPLLAIKAEHSSKFDKTDFFGPSPPNIFVGHFGHPKINLGPMVGLEDNLPDNPRDWYGWGFDKIVYARSMQIRSQINSSVHMAKSMGFRDKPSLSRVILDAQESAMSTRKVDIETKFSRKPNLDVSFHRINQPMGPSAPLTKLSVVDNPKIPKKVDALVSDGVNSTTAISELMKSHDEHYLTRLLTAGVLGKKDSRRFVPTKWGITAVDDTIAKEHMKKIRDLHQNSKYMFFQNEYLANRFSILLLPGAWEYENFESWVGAPDNFSISVEHEFFEGRAKYAASQGGGYYAARLGVCEALVSKIKRQARVVLIREILPQYDLPVGVWEIRENVRHAMQKKPVEFSTLSQLISHTKEKIKLPIDQYLSKSSVLTQSRLVDF